MNFIDIFPNQIIQGVFITISPSERHSGLTLRLLRKRARDPWLHHGEPDFKTLMQKLAAVNYPSLETVTQEWADMNECEYSEVSLPEYKLRRQAVSNDILCCVDAFLVLVKVVLATLLGIRMCPKCPHCNADGSTFPCQDQFGSNFDCFGGTQVYKPIGIHFMEHIGYYICIYIYI